MSKSTSRRLLVAAAAGLPLLLAGCFDDDDGAAGPQTLKQLAVGEINGNTTDTAEPVELNDLAIDNSNESPTEYDDILQSG